MNTKALDYAIEDAERFAQRAREALQEAVNNGSDDVEFSDAVLKTIRRLSLDVTHAMKDLRDSIEIDLKEVKP